MLTLNPAQLEISREFRAMLERLHYDIWLTVTFGVRIDEYNAFKDIKHLFKRLNRPHGICYYNDFMYCWLFAEQKAWHDRVHIHALIQHINPCLSSELKKECEERFGKTDAKPYNPTLPFRATEYLSDKYALGWVKSYDFCKINSKYRWNKKVYSGLAGNDNPTPIQVNLSEREKWMMIKDASLQERMESDAGLGN